MSAPLNPPHVMLRPRLLPAGLFATVAVAMIWAVLAWKVIDRNEHENQLAELEISRQASNTAANIEHILELTERDLLEIGALRPAPAQLDEILRRKLLKAPYLQNLLWYDGVGRLIGYGGFTRPDAQFDSLPPWIAAQDSAKSGTVLEAKGGITFAARRTADGGGILAAIIAPDALTEAPPPDILPAAATLALIAPNGMILAGRIGSQDIAGARAETIPELISAPLYGFAAQGRRMIESQSGRAVLLQLRSRPLRLLLSAPRLSWSRGLRDEAVQAAAAAVLSALAAGILLWMRSRSLRRERQLAAKLEQMFQAVEQIPASFILTDSQARIQYVNPAFQKNTGYSFEDVAGKNPRIVQSGLTPISVYQDLWGDLSRGMPWRGQMQNKRKDGGIYWEESMIAPLRDFDGRVTNYAAFKTDITDIKTVQAQLGEISQRFKSTFEQAAVGIAHVAVDGAWLRVNQRLCDILGYERSDLETMNFREITHPEDMEESLKNYHALLAGDIHSYEADKRYLRADGSVAWTRLTASSVRDDQGRPLYLIAVIQDISERKRIEHEMAQMALTLKNSNENLQQFAYVASHDLQEPLRMITSYLQLLERRQGSALSDEGREFIGFAVDGAKRMSRLISDLLTYARVDSKGSEFTKVDLGRACADATANLQMAVQDAEASITIGTLPVVFADDVQMVSLFQNLIGNALKYRAPGRAPKINVTAEMLPGRWEIIVADNGIGIAPEHHQRIFAVFQRLHGREEYDGTGIGLAVCKKIVERHSGAIYVRSDGMTGSEFIFTLPVLT